MVMLLIFTHHGCLLMLVYELHTLWMASCDVTMHQNALVTETSDGGGSTDEDIHVRCEKTAAHFQWQTFLCK